MALKWLISINPPTNPPPDKRVRERDVYQLHGPFTTRDEILDKSATIASDLGYPNELVFAAFEIEDGKPKMIFSDE
jgi:hypothetical protein